ncbi:MAG TPA: hypothetical protein PKD54_07400 [Pirellulaceae bacterium]|jgi:hypothetical protein|nr:hypothetical protein [Pirellulaceae bacterium]
MWTIMIVILVGITLYSLMVPEQVGSESASSCDPSEFGCAASACEEIDGDGDPCL